LRIHFANSDIGRVSLCMAWKCDWEWKLQSVYCFIRRPTPARCVFLSTFSDATCKARNPEWYFCFEKRVNWKRMWKATFTSSCEKCCFITLYSELYKNNIKLYSEFSDLIVLTVWTNLLGFLKDAQPEDAKFTAIYHHMPT
jgi:hypothetical protein